MRSLKDRTEESTHLGFSREHGKPLRMGVTRWNFSVAAHATFSWIHLCLWFAFKDREPLSRLELPIHGVSNKKTGPISVNRSQIVEYRQFQNRQTHYWYWPNGNMICLLRFFQFLKAYPVFFNSALNAFPSSFWTKTVSLDLVCEKTFTYLIPKIPSESNSGAWFN